MAVLITGAGYLGSALARRLASSGQPVVALENFYCTSPAQVANLADELGDRFTLVEGDVATPADVARAFDALKPNESITLYHLAAQPSAGIALRDPDYTERANLVGSRIVLEAARDRGARVVFGGSFRVYGDSLAGRAISEDAPYGRMADLSHLSKIWVEHLARMLGVAFVSVRLGVVYGLAPVTKTDPPFMTVPNLFCQRAARGQVLSVLEDRALAFIHVDDAIEGLLAGASLLGTPHTGGSPGSGPWHLANAAPEVRTIGEVARLVQRAARARGRFVRVDGAGDEAAAARQRFTVSSRLEAAGFTPRHEMATALGPVLDWFLAAEHAG